MDGDEKEKPEHVVEITGVEQALRRAAPHLLVGVVADALRKQCGALRVELRLADYALRSLQLVERVPHAAPPVLIHDSPQGRAFGAQEPYVTRETEAVSVHLPVTVRGDRMGVLTVALPAGVDLVPLLPELRHVCGALGHEILVAERDTDLYDLARRATRLTLAAEMQWQLLPGRSCSRREFALGAHLEPAYAIFGDNYDWSASADHLTLTVTNGMGEGIEAALLTNLAINALRNARRAGLGLADQAALADQAVYAQYRGEAFVSVLLLRFDLATGEVEAVDAGSPRLWRLRDRSVEPVSFEAQLPLGMFEDTVYTPQRLAVRPGDRLLFGSDGVYDAASPDGETYGDRALARALIATKLLPSSQVPGAVLRELAAYHGDAPLEDDALVVCLDWHGRQEGDDSGLPEPADA
ncbi:PP2C family protein-serine/threonine phosphatase [Streptomyces sp. WAC08241]|uniref:PP2C family protein-serine/threonine phosphatase n=1 Tax=Streptomyces sp. WAC08241 TaxID=2487421 RepID=UPI000F76EF4B|nr:PP2C family protein-serine/threonine phosphatase [Streptomyces sp. WAC08241]RSS35664.1 serine/threonine-protein phosphatase [Streptomyces sp. WAC08241]